MVLVDVDIAQEQDDFQIVHSSGTQYEGVYDLSNATWTYARFGTQPSYFSGNRAFFLFKGITIPIGSTIDNATLTLKAMERVGANAEMSIRAVNNSAPVGITSNYTNGGGTFWNTPVLTPAVTFSVTDTQATDFALDVKLHVQALVNSFDYNNEAMMFRMIKTPITTSTLQFELQGFEYQVSPPDSGANLTINYTEGCASDFCEDFDEYALSKLPLPREIFNYSTKTLADLAWTSQDEPDNQVDVVNENYFFTVKRDGTDVSSSIDLGTVVSDERWTLRAKVVIGTPYTITSQLSSAMSIGLEDTDSSVGIGSLNNFLRIGLINTIIGGGSQHQNSSLFNGVGDGAEGTTTGWTAGDTRYIELKRLSRTEFQTTIYTDAEFSVILDRVIKTIPAGIRGLRFIKIGTPHDNEPTYNGVFTGTIDNIEFWNEGSQGDITFQDNFLQKPVTLSDDFSGADNWVDQGTRVQVNTITDVIDIDCTKESVLHQTSFDLGGVSDDQWVLRFDCEILTTSVPTTNDFTILVSLSDSDQTVGVLGAQDTIAWEHNVQGDTGVDRMLLRWADGVGILPGTGNNFFVTSGAPTASSGKFFIEIKRLSATDCVINHYSDSTFTTLVDTTGRQVIPSTITNLRFIRVSTRDDVTSAGSQTARIDKIEFFNGNSTLADWSGAIGNDVRLDIINERINFDIPQGVQRDELLTFDLGANVSEDNWTLRFKINTDNIAQGTSEQSASLFVGLDDQNLTPANSAPHDFIAFGVVIDQGGAGPQFGATPTLRTADAGEYFTGTSGSNFPFMWATGTLYVELKRISKTLCECTLFTDADFRNVFSVPQQVTISSTLDGLRYIRLTTDSSAVANDTVWDGAIDDIEFYNGVAVPRTPIEEIPKLFNDNVWDDQGWVTTDATAMAVNTGTQVLDINVLRDSSQDAIAFDLGAGVLSETRWGLRFKYDITAVDPVNTGTKRIACGIFDTNQVASIASPQDYIGVNFNLATDTTAIIANATNNSNPQSASFSKTFTSVITQVQTYYIEIIRISATSYSVEIFSDPDYSISLEKATIDNISSLTSGLRYIKFLGDETSGPVAGSFTGTIDDIQLWNDQAPLDHKNKWRVLDL